MSAVSGGRAAVAMSGRLSLEDRALGAYWGVAIGDALGAPVEFMRPEEIRRRYGVHQEMTGGGWLSLRPGQVTDDTQMTLALGRALIKGGPKNATVIADEFCRWLDTHPVDVGTTVHSALLRYQKTGEPRARASRFSAGNGALMRTLPTSLLTLGAPVSSVEEVALRQANVTHRNPLADTAVVAVTHMQQAALRGASTLEILHGLARPLVEARSEFRFRPLRVVNPSGFVVPTVQAVLQAFIDTDDFESCLVDLVNRGGDADTTGAIVGSLAGAVYGPDAIPRRWLKRIPEFVLEENEQARRLYQRCGFQGAPPEQPGAAMLFLQMPLGPG